MHFLRIIKQPSACLPLAMSLAAFALVIGTVTVHGVVHEPDEGTAAHLFQMLIAGQVPIVAFFAVKWLPRTPRPAACVLAAQVGAVLAALAPVYFFHL